MNYQLTVKDAATGRTFVKTFEAADFERAELIAEHLRRNLRKKFGESLCLVVVPCAS